MYEKYRTENTTKKVSYTVFSRLRQFWVVFPKEGDRETCACKQHENLLLLSEVLHKNELIKTRDLYTLVNMFACDTKSITCMYGKCPNCQEIIVSAPNIEKNMEIKWFQWKTRREKCWKNVTVKTKETGDFGDLIDNFSEEMSRFTVHFYNIENQLKHYICVWKKTSKKTSVWYMWTFLKTMTAKCQVNTKYALWGVEKANYPSHRI